MSTGKRKGKLRATQCVMTSKKKGMEEKERVEKRSKATDRMEGKQLEEVWEIHKNRNQSMKEERAIDRNRERLGEFKEMYEIEERVQ